MVRYFMSFSVPEGRQHSAQKIINLYFHALNKQGPGGMRSQCYASHEDDRHFVHIKSFKREAVANHHFKSALFREYIGQLADLCGDDLSFARLQQQQTFESIY
jgi:quinol monooxygenase YgiN